MSKRELDFYEQSITRKYRHQLYSKFVSAIKEYQLIQEKDHICVCISGGKDSMLMAKMFMIFHEHGDIPFDVTYLVMDPGYNEKNLTVIKENIAKLSIPAIIRKTDIFEVANAQIQSPCFLCAKMRRGALYNLAKELGCNKIALGHHYDDVIETTLMNLLNAGSFQTMLPKLISDHYVGMEVIRPLYLVREKNIIAWKNYCELTFIQCACSFTEKLSQDELTSQRAFTKALIKELHKNNPQVEQNLFIASENVNLDMILGYKSDKTGKVSFLDDYEQKKKEKQLSKGEKI